MNIYSCLLALLLACNVTAEIIYQVVKEGKSAFLSCSHFVEGKVTWSREIDGRKVNIFATDGKKEERFNDPQRRYSSTADKPLFISGPAVSDSGTYYCNNEPAAELTVIPSGTEILEPTERSSITLTCPHDDGGSHVPTWIREIGGKQQPIRLHDSTVTRMLMLPNLQPADSGLYLCDGKPAVYLNVIKEIISQGVKEGKSAFLSCPHSVEGKVTWSREINGRKVDIFATDGKEEERIYDPQRRYGSTPDKPLFISGAAVSDSGTYYCNNEPAVELTVIPSGTEILQTTERSSITLTCPHDDGGSHVLTWSREIGGYQKPIRLHVSTVTRMLMLPNLQPADSGLYLCDGKPAVYLNVIKEEKTTTTSTMTTTIPTTTTPTRRQTAATTKTMATTKKSKDKTTTLSTITSTTASTTSAPPADTDMTVTTSPATNSTTSAPSADTETLYLVLWIAVPSVLVLLIIIIIIITCCTCRRRSKKQAPPNNDVMIQHRACSTEEEKYAVYEEIQDGGSIPTNRVNISGRPSTTINMADLQGDSNQNDHAYHTIPDLPPTGNRTDTSRTNELTYSLIKKPSPDGNKQDTTRTNELTYSLIKKPSPDGNKQDTTRTNELTYSLIKKSFPDGNKQDTSLTKESMYSFTTS